MPILHEAGLLASLAVALLALSGSSAAAQSDLPAEIGEAYTHERTGIEFPEAIAGVARNALRDLGREQFDIVAGYGSWREGDEISVYLYRAAIPDVSLWFGVTAEAIAARTQMADRNAQGHEFVPFTPPGGAPDSALRLIFDTQGPQITSTGLALVQRGNWLLKFRVSSSTKDSTELGRLLDQVIDAFPAGSTEAAAPPAYLVQPCATPLRLHAAQSIEGGESPADMTTALALMLSAVEKPSDAAEQAAGAQAGPRTTWCRDSQRIGPYPVFRPSGSDDAYLIALSDAGTAIAVGHVDLAMRQVAAETSILIPVAELTADGTTLRALYDSTPNPDLVAQALERGNRLAFTNRLDQTVLDRSLGGD